MADEKREKQHWPKAGWRYYPRIVVVKNQHSGKWVTSILLTPGGRLQTLLITKDWERAVELAGHTGDFYRKKRYLKYKHVPGLDRPVRASGYAMSDEPNELE